MNCYAIVKFPIAAAHRALRARTKRPNAFGALVRACVRATAPRGDSDGDDGGGGAGGSNGVGGGWARKTNWIDSSEVTIH